MATKTGLGVCIFRTVPRQLIAIALACLCLSACNGSRSSLELQESAGNASDPPGGLELAPPSEYLSQLPAGAGARAGSALTEADVLRSGSQFEALLPFNRCNVDGSGLVFIPVDSDSSFRLENLSFAGYRFEVPGYDRSDRVVLDWLDAPPHGLVWLGLSDWGKDRWIWFPANASFVINVADMQRFISGEGSLLAVVVAGGADSVFLESLRLGRIPPVPALTLTPDAGAPPLDVSLDASASAAGEGTISKVEWDLLGDGNFVNSAGGITQIEHTYTEEGQIRPAVRITNSAGESAVTDRLLQLNSHWIHTYGLASFETVHDIATSPDGSIYLAVSIEDPGLTSRYDVALAKLSPAGEMLWFSNYETVAHGDARCLALDGDGNVFLAGSLFVAGHQEEALLQKWNADGELLWSKTFGLSDEPDRLETVLSYGGDVYFCGSTGDPDPTAGLGIIGSDAIVGSLNSEGGMRWIARRSQGNGPELLRSMVLRPMPQIKQKISCLGTYSIESGSSYIDHVWRLDFDSDGEFTAGHSLDFTAPARGSNIRFSGVNELSMRFYVTGSIFVENTTRLFFLKIGASGASESGSLTNGAFSTNDLIFDGQGGLAAVGPGLFGGTHALYSFDPVSGLLDSAKLYTAADLQFTALAPFRGGVLICGQAELPVLEVEDIPFVSDPVTASWVGAAGSAAEYFVFPADSSGIVSSLGPIMVTDEGAGESDMLVSFGDPL